MITLMSQVFDPDWHGTRFSECGSYVILYWNRLTRQEFNMPGHHRIPTSISPFPCVLASLCGVCWDGKIFRTSSSACDVSMDIYLSEGPQGRIHREYLTAVPPCMERWNATLLNGNQKHPKLRLLLRRPGGLTAIKQLRMTWDEFLLKFPVTVS